MLASEAAKMTGDDFIVQPLLTSLKYMLGSVDGMQEDMMFYNKADMQSDPSLDIMLCPGVGVADANATDANATEILSWDALLEALKTDMIGALTGTDQSIIFDAIYMTSDAYFSAASKQEATARSLWWKGIIQKLEENDYYCDDMYANRSTWTIQPTKNPENSDSILNVKVSATGDVEHDTTCMVTLSMAIAAHPNVCSIETRQRMKKHTVSVTSWLTQSELKDKTPFFDVSGGAILHSTLFFACTLSHSRKSLCCHGCRLVWMARDRSSRFPIRVLIRTTATFTILIILQVM